MATVTTSHAPRKVFFAQLDGLSGALAKLDDGRVYFFHPESGDLREVTSYKGLMALGEVGLAGEVRAVAQVEPRLAEAAKMGFKRVVMPRSSASRLDAETGRRGSRTVARSRIPCMTSASLARAR